MSMSADDRGEARETTRLERLRHRTDELELIISSLTIFALFSLPSWLFESFADNYTHLSTGLTIAGLAISVVLTGICYLLGACFVVHLMARAYWVGLIGLRSAFPDGIDWERTKSLGPLTREHYRSTLPAQDTLIDRTDRFASSLFAVISMLTLHTLWLGALLVATTVSAALVGARFGATNAALSAAFVTLSAVLAGVPVLTYLLDAQLAARIRVLRESVVFAALISVLRRISAIAYPRRLLLPVQLTLQSNTRPFLFYAVLVVALVAVFFVGNWRVTAWRTFTLSDEFTYLGVEETRSGLRSSHYEDMPSEIDDIRPWPRISSFTQRGSFLVLFLPYHPLRDNLMLDERCAGADTGPDRVACLRDLWAVSLGGREVPLEDFLPAQRADLAMRGLMGVVSLEGLTPGLQQLEVTWNPEPPLDARLDDRYEQVSSRFSIPFVFAPEFERQLD